MASYVGADAVGKAKQLAIVVRQLQAEAEHFSERMAGARAVAEEAWARADVARAALEELRGKYQRDTDKYRRRVGLGRCRRWHGCEIDACEEPPRGVKLHCAHASAPHAYPPSSLFAGNVTLRWPRPGTTWPS